jgi:hypothetical protein
VTDASRSSSDSRSTRDERRKVRAAWPAVTAGVSWDADAERVQFVAVNNVLIDLMGYPHGESERLSNGLGVGADGLVDSARL